MRKQPQLVHMNNRAMEEMLLKGSALDLSEFWTGVEDPDGVRLYRLPPSWTSKIAGKMLCDAREERWIDSVGRRKADPHDLFASTDARFYNNPDWVCLWLR